MERTSRERMKMSTKNFRLTIVRQEGYRFRVEPETSDAPPFFIDEAPPLGHGSAPAPTELLGGAVGGCLSASLLYCLRDDEAFQNGLTTRVEGSVERNDEGRLRVTGLQVILELDGALEDTEAADCVDTFEDFCTVTESVRRGIPVSVEVRSRPRATTAEQD